MPLRKGSAAVPDIPGADSLQSWIEFEAIPGWGASAPDVAWTGFAFSRALPAMFAAGNPAAVWGLRGNQTAFFRIINDIKVLDVFAIAGAIGGQECAQVFQPAATMAGANGFMDFVNDFSPLLEPSAGIGLPLAMSVSGWIRKRLAGDATSCAQFVGFANDNGDLNFSRRVARIGIMGDGALGFRFGSVNCPDAPAGGNDNAATDIDGTNIVQPALLVNPGVNWFHVRVKAIPGFQGQPGRFGCYLNGRLVAVYTNPVNFPRTSRSAIDVSGGAYWPIKPAFCAFGNGGAAPSPGYYMRDIRAGYGQDLAL